MRRRLPKASLETTKKSTALFFVILFMQQLHPFSIKLPLQVVFFCVFFLFAAVASEFCYNKKEADWLLIQHYFKTLSGELEQDFR